MSRDDDRKERSSRVEVNSPKEPRDTQRSTTTGETSANRGSNLNDESLSRDGRTGENVEENERKR